MDLYAVAALLWLWECLLRQPGGGLLLAAPFRRVRPIRGAGWRLRSPLPSAPALLAQSVPRALEPRLEAQLRESLSLERARAALASALRATRWLAPLCDVYAFVAFGVTGALLWLDEEDRVLRGVLPLLAVLHGVCVALLWRGHARLSPAVRGRRFDLVLAAALYPPAALASPRALYAEAFAGVHPLAAAAALLAPRDFAGFARRERAWLERAVHAGDGHAGVERAGLDAICLELGVDAASPPPRADPEAASYCPLCFADFRTGFAACEDCRVATVPYPAR